MVMCLLRKTQPSDSHSAIFEKPLLSGFGVKNDSNPNTNMNVPLRMRLAESARNDIRPRKVDISMILVFNQQEVVVGVQIWRLQLLGKCFLACGYEQ